MSETNTVEKAQSKLPLYRGVIALAWADHELHPEEKSKLHEMISAHRELTTEDRAKLHAEIHTRISLADVWPHITDPQDRARLIDLSNIIFQQDDEFCDDERLLIERFQAKHLASIDISSIEKDLAQFSSDQTAQREQERQTYREWAKQYGVIEQIRSVFSGR